jgi:O-antigen ligase
MRRWSFTWWEVAWLVVLLSGLSFRARTAAEISDSPVDAWALYRITCVGIVAVILFVRLTLRRTNWLPFLFSGVVGTFALYPLLSLVSTVWSVNPPWTIYKSLEFLIDLSMVAATVATFQSVVEYRKLVNWTWTLLGLLVVSAWVGVIIDPSDALFPDPSIRFAALPIRLLGLVPVVSSNDLSEIAAILGLVALCRIFADEASQQRTTRYWCLFGAASVTLVVTQTRGSFLAFLVGVVLLLILTRRYILLTLGGVTSFIALIPLLLFTKLGSGTQDFLLRGEKVEVASGMSGRLETWQQALEKIAQHPWIGYGGFAGAKFVILSKSSWASDTLSSYFDSLLNIGVFGLAILLIVLIRVGYLLFQSTRNSRLSDSENYLALELFIAFIVVAIRSIESSNVITHPMFSTMTLLGCAEFLRRRKLDVLRFPADARSLV